MTLEQLVTALQDRRLDKVSKATNLHVNTIRAIRDGENKNPKLSTIKALNDYLESSNVDKSL